MARSHLAPTKQLTCSRQQLLAEIDYLLAQIESAKRASTTHFSVSCDSQGRFTGLDIQPAKQRAWPRREKAG